MNDPIQIKGVVLTVSDSRKTDDDVSGRLLADLLRTANAEIIESVIVSDDLDEIRQTLYTLTERPDVNLIITTGGTGFGPRDNTPEATRSVIDREAPGIAEAMRRETASKTPMAMLSRGVAGIRNGTLIINLPGSPKGVEECFAVVRPILNHAVDLISGHTSHSK
ncbi:MAG TPA: MogA/MoaB family molybdenum cofactor biosynthesis protein [Pyrinomonadaceae bacterium]|nr:MogA/MoaB family molybdenum cofactor biosynthesis protein [Pyrinomonadaceae bacterium]